MNKRLDFGVAAFAFIGAIFWFLSAYGSMPNLVTYWGSAPANDPFYVALKYSAQMNRWAAVFSGLSALCAAAKFIFK